MPTSRVSKLTNELVVFIDEADWDPSYVVALTTGGTPQITVDSVKSYRTPFGTFMILTTLTVTRNRAQTWNLREYVARRLTVAGLPTEVGDVLAPARAKFYRV